MTWGGNQVTLLIIDASGAFTGLFVYSPVPGPGNLIFSIAAAAGTDPYGNAYLPTATSYIPSTGQTLQINGAGIQFFDSSTTLEGFLSELKAIGTSGVPSIVIQSPSNNAGVSNNASLVAALGESQDGTNPARILLGGFSSGASLLNNANVVAVSTFAWAHPGFTGGATLPSYVAGLAGSNQIVFANAATLPVALSGALFEFQAEVAVGPSLLIAQGAAAPTVATGFFGVWADTFGDIHVMGPLFVDSSGFLQLGNISAPAAGSGANRAFSSSNGNLQAVASGDGNTYSTQVLHADLSSTSITAQTPSFTTIGPAITVSAQKYKVHVRGYYAGAAAGTPRFSFSTPAIGTAGPTSAIFQQNNSTNSFGAQSSIYAGPAMASATVMADIWAEWTFSASGSLQFEANTSASPADNFTWSAGTMEIYPVA